MTMNLIYQKKQKVTCSRQLCASPMLLQFILIIQLRRYKIPVSHDGKGKKTKKQIRSEHNTREKQTNKQKGLSNFPSLKNQTLSFFKTS